MLRTIKPEKLPDYLGRIERTFPELQANRPVGAGDISRYYEKSALGYALFHSSEGAIHMGISRDGRFNKNDYFAQAEDVAALCQSLAVKGAVVEAGCGRGFNLGFIGTRLPTWECTGLDITPAHIKWAQKKFRGLPNVRFELADFHQLDQHVSTKQHVVFFVESICHASDLPAVLRSAYRALANDGKVVVFDGFRSGEIDGESWRIAAELVEAAMAVPRFPTVQQFTDAAITAGFEIEAEEDLSEAIMPNLLKLSDTAKGFFKFPPVTRLLTRMLPPQLAANSVAGLLMPLTVSERIHRYYKFVLRKT